jgi:fructan beta-fructosidase
MKTAVTYAGGKVSCLGATADLSPVDGKLKLRILVNRTSTETFAHDGKVSMTSCLLPEKKNTGLGLYTKEETVNIRSLTVTKLTSSWSTT